MITGSGQLARAAGTQSLISRVSAACKRLAPQGWQQLLLEATGGQLNIGSTNLKDELTKPLQIDRAVPGFGDFNLSANRAIEAGFPDRSLLYHAFASPAVVAGRNGLQLKSFPTLAEIEAVLNYVYGVNPPTMDTLRRRAAGRPLGIVAFALQYEDGPDSVHGTHAELCFARAGIARLGNIEPFYDSRSRSFLSLDPARPFDFRVMPRQFAPYLAIQMSGSDVEREQFGPQDALESVDGDLKFWVPIHKLFDGRECLAGLDLDVTLERGLRNDALAMFHKWLMVQGLMNNWSGEDLENYPFLIKDESIGSLSQKSDYGAGLLIPRPQPLTSEARYKGQLLTFPVDGSYTGDSENIQLSSLQVLPAPPSGLPRYGIKDAAQDSQRPAPGFTNIRHRVLPGGHVQNLNEQPKLKEIIKEGGYNTLHYTDGAGDGWIEAKCSQLTGLVDANIPAYCMVGLPDFFPKVKQRDLMLWWNQDVPKPIRDALWAIPPLALSQTRIAANITLPIGFSINDVTVTAMITQPDRTTSPGSAIKARAGAVQTPNGPLRRGKTGMPDGAAGVFDPGWETSQGIYFSSPSEKTPLQKFLAGYALGSPFIEDAKLCAALGAYWPGVAPDSTRVFQPDKQISGNVYPFPTIAPLTDQEIGSAPLPNGQFMPWDGVRGPDLKFRVISGQRHAVYTDAWRTDYIELAGTMTAALTSQIDLAEYKARILAMEAVYWGLGIQDTEFKDGVDLTATEKILSAKAKWAVLSFRNVVESDKDAMVAAAAASSAASWQVNGPKLYFFHVYRWEGKEFTDPSDIRKVLVKVVEEATAYVSGTDILIKREGQPWKLDTSMPM